jgi:hypothetical protein
MKALHEAREPYYRLADYVVEAGTRPAGDVAAEVVTLAKQHAGW